MTRHTDAPGEAPDANDDRSERANEPERSGEGPTDPPEETVTLVNYGGGDRAEYAGESVREWVLADTDALVSLEENR